MHVYIHVYICVYILCNYRFEVISLILLIMYNPNLVSVLFRFQHHYMPFRLLNVFFILPKRGLLCTVYSFIGMYGIHRNPTVASTPR